MNIIEKQIVKQYHRDRIREFAGEPARIQGWSDQQAQMTRFETILSLADFNNAVILDIGCGYGELKQLLDQRFENFKYIGIDQQPEFIAKARLTHKNLSNTEFIEADFSTCQLPEVDIIVASGVFAYKSADKSYFLKMIKKLFASAGRYFIFNMLDAETCHPQSLLTAHNKLDIYSYCKTVCKNTKLVTGYTNDDFTISMSRVNN